MNSKVTLTVYFKISKQNHSTDFNVWHVDTLILGEEHGDSN